MVSCARLSPLSGHCNGSSGGPMLTASRAARTAAVTTGYISVSGAPTHIFEAKSSYSRAYTSYKASCEVDRSCDVGGQLNDPRCRQLRQFRASHNLLHGRPRQRMTRRLLNKESETTAKLTAWSSGNGTSVMAECCDGNTQLTALKNKKGLQGQVTQVVWLGWIGHRHGA